MNSRFEPSRARAASLAALALAAVCLLAPAAKPPTESGDVDGARELLQRWVETRRQISKEKQEWALGRELLDSRIELVSSEIAAVKAKTAEVEASIAEAEGKRSELEAKRTSLMGTSTELASSVASLEARTRELLRRAPDPLREKLRPISQSLPSDPALAEKGKLGERFLTVVGILNELNKFNREVRAESELRTLPSGATIEVTTVYVGLGQAYYSSGDGKTAGYGWPSSDGAAAPDGWQWRAADEHAAQIARGIAILTKGADAEFVNLPIQVQ